MSNQIGVPPPYIPQGLPKVSPPPPDRSPYRVHYAKHECYLDISDCLALDLLKGLMSGEARKFTVIEDAIPADAKVLRLEALHGCVVRIVFSSETATKRQYTPCLRVET